MSRVRAIVREAVVSAVSGRLASITTIVLVAGMCAAVLLTSGRAVGAQQQVLSSIDEAGTRAILIRATPDAGLDSTVLDRLAPVGGIETAFALGPAEDVRNTSLPDGAPVPVRDYWGPVLTTATDASQVVLSPRAVEELGMLVAAGSVTRSNGTILSVKGLIADPGPLADFEPLALTPREPEDTGRVAIVVVVTSDAHLVAAVTDTIRPLIAAADPSAVSITDSEALATLRGTVQAQLGAFGSTLAAGVLALTGLLVAIVQSALVLLRRKDFGRRRALGATRGLIAALILIQTASLATAGAAVGVAASAITLSALGDPLPSVDYTAAVALLALGVSVAAAIVPAILAARRDPIRELRVP